MKTTDSTETARSTPWIVGGRIDSAFFFGGLFVAAAAAVVWISGGFRLPLVTRGDSPAPLELVMFASGIVILIPHFLVSWIVWLGNRSLREADRRAGSRIAWANAIFLVAVPPLVLWLAADPRRLLWLITGQVLLELHHILSQDRGFLSLYRHRVGSDAAMARRENRLLRYLFAWTAFHAFLAPRSVVLEGTIEPLLFANTLPRELFLATHVVGALMVIDLVVALVRDAGTRAGPQLLYLASLLASCGLILVDPFVGFFALRFHHSSGYMGLSFHLLRNLVRSPGVGPWMERLGRLRITAPRFVGVLAVLALPLSVLNFHGSEASGPPLAIGLISVVFLHHYFLDALIWRFRRPEIREAVLPYL